MPRGKVVATRTVEDIQGLTRLQMWKQLMNLMIISNQVVGGLWNNQGGMAKAGAPQNPRVLKQRCMHANQIQTRRVKMTKY